MKKTHIVVLMLFVGLLFGQTKTIEERIEGIEKSRVSLVAARDRTITDLRKLNDQIIFADGVLAGYNAVLFDTLEEEPIEEEPITRE